MNKELKQDKNMWFKKAVDSGGEVEVLKLRIKELEEKTIPNMKANHLKTIIELGEVGRKLNAIEEVLIQMEHTEYTDCESVYDEYIKIKNIIKE